MCPVLRVIYRSLKYDMDLVAITRNIIGTVSASAYNFADGGVVRLEVACDLKDSVAEVHQKLRLLDVLVFVAADFVLVKHCRTERTRPVVAAAALRHRRRTRPVRRLSCIYSIIQVILVMVY